MRVLLGLVIIVLANNTFAQPSQQNNSPVSPEPPQVQIEIQPDSPLRISAVKTQWVSERRGIELYITVENINGKDISAYATRDTKNGDAANSCLLIRAASPGKVLRPARSEGRTTWRGYDSLAPEPLRRFVDFVEFTDGTTWGPDLCQSAESLAGQRAGAREARKMFREKFATAGADGVIELLKSWLPPTEPPPDQSPAWRAGFGSGFSSYDYRLRRANEEWGFTEIEYTLGRPIDALPDEAALGKDQHKSPVTQTLTGACISTSKGCARR